MADFVRPTYTEILGRVQADIDARLDGTDSYLRRSVLNVLAHVQAALAHALYGFIDFVSKQIFLDTAETEYLNRHGVIYGVERLQAVQASGLVTFSGTDGAVIPAATQILRSDSEVFITKEVATIASGTASVTAEADTPGDIGNTSAGSTLTLIAPIAGVDSEVLVGVGGMAGGIDLEDDDSYRERIFQKIQQPPQGGSATDYEMWALEANPAVTNAWVYPLEDGPGSVVVRIMTYGSTVNGIPEPEVIDIVQDYIDTKKPVTASATVEAPTPKVQNFTIDLDILDGYNEVDVQTDVAANLADMLRRDAIPGGAIYKNVIIENVLATPGVFNANVTVPSADVTTTAGEIVVMGTITWA